MKDISLSRVGQLLIVIIGLLAAGCAGLRITPPADMTPIPDTTGCMLLSFGEGALWSVQCQHKGTLYPFPVQSYSYELDHYVLRIEPETNKVTAQVLIPETSGWPISLDVGEGAVWVAYDNSSRKIYKIDPMTNRVVATIPWGGESFLYSLLRPNLIKIPTWNLAVGEGAVWVVREGVLFRVDTKSNEVTSIPLSHKVDFVSVGAGAVWAGHSSGDAISRIDLRTHQLVATIPTPPSLRMWRVWRSGQWMTMGAGGMWVLLGRRDWPFPTFPTMVGLLDPQSNQFVATIDLQAHLTDIDAKGASIWVAAQNVERHYLIKGDTVYHSIVEIDSTTNTVKRKISCGSVSDDYHYPKYLAIGADAVWIYLPFEGIYRLPFGDGSSQRK